MYKASPLVGHKYHSAHFHDFCLSNSLFHLTKLCPVHKPNTDPRVFASNIATIKYKLFFH